MNKDKIKVFFFVAAALDLISLYRNRVPLFYLSGMLSNLTVILHVLLLASLFVSAALLILNKKAGFIIYYFQFPLRLAFRIMSFGFLFAFMPASASNNLIQNISLGIVVGLEMLRLVLTIVVHRRG